MYYLMLFLGVVLFILFRLNKAIKVEEFSWNVFLKRNTVSALINFIVGIVIILAQEDIQDIFPVTKFTITFAGFGGAALFQYLISMVDPQSKTKIGFNKK